MLEVSNRALCDILRRRATWPLTEQSGRGLVASCQRVDGYTAFCNGPDDVKSPDECRAAELILLSVVNVLPPHHTVPPRSRDVVEGGSAALQQWATPEAWASDSCRVLKF
jgi:hypothetical protein